MGDKVYFCIILAIADTFSSSTSFEHSYNIYIVLKITKKGNNNV